MQNQIKQRITELRNIIYEKDCAGGALHIVLDDLNVEDDHIKWCLNNSIAEINDEQEKQIFTECANLLLQLSFSARTKLVKQFHNVPLQLDERFNDYEDEYLKFDSIENKLSDRPDLCALILLNKLFPSTNNIIGATEHDIMYINISRNEIKTLTDDQIVYLIRCGIHFNSEFQCLCKNT